MSMQSSPAAVPVCDEAPRSNGPPGSATLKKRKYNRVADFFNRVNPASWFNDFKDIEISLGEFACKKK